MNIYYVGWEQDSQFALCAVVVAGSESEALSVIDLDKPYNSNIQCVCMGTCTDGSKTAHVVCSESL